MFKTILRLVMLSSLLFIPFFSIAQDSEYVVERFCQAVSLSIDYLSCIDEKVDFSKTEGFYSRHLIAGKSCLNVRFQGIMV